MDVIHYVLQEIDRMRYGKEVLNLFQSEQKDKMPLQLQKRNMEVSDSDGYHRWYSRNMVHHIHQELKSCNQNTIYCFPLVSTSANFIFKDQLVS